MADRALRLTVRELKAKTPVELRTLLEQALVELTDLVPLLDKLADTHQAGLGFLTVDGRRIMDEQLRKERDGRLRNAKEGITITGEVPAPVNITAVSLADEIPAVLAHTAQRMRRRLKEADQRVPPSPTRVVDGLPARPTTGQWITDVRSLLGLVDGETALISITRDLQDLVERTRNVVHGNDRTGHPKPCPYCGRHTLVVYLTQGVIRCEPDPEDGQPCICDDSYCDCKVRHHRHEWARADGHKKWGWYGLKRAQELVEREHIRRTEKEG